MGHTLLWVVVFREFHQEREILQTEQLRDRGGVFLDRGSGWNGRKRRLDLQIRV